MVITQAYAKYNRKVVLDKAAEIIHKLCGAKVDGIIHTVHNYVDFGDMVLRKGAIRSYEGELIVVPFNMRDGVAICEGLSNEDWNWSAPHGSGRRMSRSEAHKTLKMKDYKEDSTDYDKLCALFEKYEIGFFFYIGGNDSMDTVAKLSVYTREQGLDVKVIGIPKTIDNDLTMIDHTPGFGSAAKFISTAMLEMAHDTYIYNIDTVLIVEIMGRNSGWLTAASALAEGEDRKGDRA